MKKLYRNIEILYGLLSTVALVEIWLLCFDIKIYDLYYLGAILFLNMALFLGFGAFFGKMLSSSFLLFYTACLTAQRNYYDRYQFYFSFNIQNLMDYCDGWLVAAVAVVMLVFCVLYVKYQKKVEKKYHSKHLRPSFLVLIGSCAILIGLADLSIEKQYNENRYMSQETDYYTFLHPERSEEYVDTFGILTYMWRDLSDNVDTLLYAKKDIAEIEEYLASKTDPQLTALSGILKEKNVVFIQCSGLDIDEIGENTPCLKQLTEEGLTLFGFLSPSLKGERSDSTFMANTSLVPDGICTAAAYYADDNTYPCTLAGLFKNNGYSSLLLYNDYGIYDNLKKMATVYGYDEFWDCTDMGSSAGMKNEDVGKIIAGNLSWYQKKNMTYWIATDNGDIADMEKAIAAMFSVLEETGKKGDYAFVLFDDGGNEATHCPYLYLYSTEVSGLLYGKYSTAIDILPMIADLFDFSYDNRFVVGQNPFDERYAGFAFSYSPDYMWYSGLLSYDALNHIYYPSTDDDVSLWQDAIEEGKTMLDVSRKIIEHNYFRSYMKD